MNNFGSSGPKNVDELRQSSADRIKIGAEPLRRRTPMLRSLNPENLVCVRCDPIRGLTVERLSIGKGFIELASESTGGLEGILSAGKLKDCFFVFPDKEIFYRFLPYLSTRMRMTFESEFENFTFNSVFVLTRDLGEVFWAPIEEEPTIEQWFEWVGVKSTFDLIVRILDLTNFISKRVISLTEKANGEVIGSPRALLCIQRIRPVISEQDMANNQSISHFFG